MRWKRIIGWIGAIIGALIIVVVVGALIVLHTAWFHDYVLANVEKDASESIGGRVDIQNFDFRFSGLTADLYGITVHGAEGVTQKPLLQVDKLTVGVKIISLLHKQFNLSEVLLVHPVVNLVVNEKNQNNLPHSATSSSGSSTNVFQFAIWHTGLSRGEIYYNDKESKLDANIYDLRANINFDRGASRYAGSLSYANGQLQYDSHSPLAHSADVRFSATPSGAEIQSALLKVGSSQITLHAQAADYSNLRVNGSYDLLLHTQDFASLMSGGTAQGDISSSGVFRYQNAPNVPAMRAALLNGKISANTIRVSSPQANVTLQNLGSTFDLADGNLHVSDFSADTFGGRLTATANVQHLDSTPSSSLKIALQRISLAAMQGAVREPSLQRTPLSGTLEGKAEAAWSGSMSGIQAQAELAVHGQVPSRQRNTASIPVNAVIKGSYDGTHDVIAVRQANVNLPSLSVLAQGQISKRSKLKIQASSNDLHQLSALAASLEAISAKPGTKRPEAIPISGTANLNATVQGSMKRPAISAQLGAQNLLVEGSQWKSLSLSLAANPSQIIVQNGSLSSATQGNVTFNAQVGLKDWGYSDRSPITATVSAKQLSITPLLELANQKYPLSGNLSADVVVNGSQLNPSGHGTIQITKATAYDQPIQSLAVQFHGNGQAVTTSLIIKTPAGSANGDLTFAPETRAYAVSLRVPDLILQKLQPVQARNTGLQGTLMLTANGRGTLDNPQLTAKIEVPQLTVQQKSLSSITADLNVAQHHAQATLKTNVLQSSIQAHANVELIGDYDTDAAIDTSNIPLEPVLAAFAPTTPAGFQGATELHASLKGPLKDPTKVIAHLTIPNFSATYQSLQIATAGALSVDYSDNVVTLQPVEFRGTDTDLRLQGRIPLSNAGSMAVDAHGSVDLRLIRIFSPDVRSSGTLALNVNSTGNLRAPDLKGRIQLQDASFSQTDVPLGLENGNGVFDIDSNKITINSLSGDVGGGTVSASGSVAYRPAIQAGVTLHAKAVNLLYPTGVRTVLDSTLLFAGTQQAATLTGQVLLDSLSFTPAFDLTSLGTQFSGVTVPSATPSFTDNIKLALSVQSSENLAAYSSQISLQGSVNLQVIGTATNPVIVGRTDLTSGDLFFMNNRYVLQRGIISFNNPNETEPVLNVEVTTTIEQYNLTLALQGPLDKLDTSYTSQPPLATADIISLLYRGETTAEASAAGTSADSMIAGQVAGQFTSGISKLAGISSLQIDPLIGGNNSNPSARVALQQRVTKNLLFTFSTDVEQPQSEIVEGDYQINKRWSVGVIRDEVGGISVDARVHTSH